MPSKQSGPAGNLTSAPNAGIGLGYAAKVARGHLAADGVVDEWDSAPVVLWRTEVDLDADADTCRPRPI